MPEAASKRSAQTFFKQWSAVLGALVLCLQAERLPVLRRQRSPKFFSLFAHKGSDRQWSEAELPVTGKGASLLYIGALVPKCAMAGGARRFLGAKAVLRFRDSLLLCSSYETFGIEFCFL